MNTPVWRSAVRAPRLALVLAAALIGCSRPSGVERLPVYGTVSDPSGEKIGGSISFVPDQGRPGPGATASLIQGEYRFDKTNGPTAGLHRVIVTRTSTKDPAGKQAGSPKRPLAGKRDANARSPTAPWTLSADVPAKGPYRIDLELP
jgi:hypothetical protein